MPCSGCIISMISVRRLDSMRRRFSPENSNRSSTAVIDSRPRRYILGHVQISAAPNCNRADTHQNAVDKPPPATPKYLQMSGLHGHVWTHRNYVTRIVAPEVASACHRTCRHPVAVACPDTTLIPPRTQYGATQGKSEKGKPFRYGVFATPCIPLQPLTDHS